MAKWINLPSEPLKFHPYQHSFWLERRQRLCNTCQIEFECPPHNVCPQCKTKGERKWNHMTLLSGRRGGKTVAGSIAGAEEASIPNTIGWACAPTNPKLHRYVIPAFQKIIPVSAVALWDKENLDLWLKNGSLIHFQTLEDPDQGRGQGLDWLWIDEVCELTLKHWEVIEPSLVDRKGLAFFTSSPRSYDWVWKSFYKRAEDEIPGYWATRYSTIENPFIDPKEIEAKKLTMTPTMFQQEFMADFVVFEGAVYGDLVDPQILYSDESIKQFIPEWPEIASWRPITVGIDTGADHPFGGLKLVSTEKGLVCVGEYLERNKTFLQHANALKQLGNASNVRWAINKNEKQGITELGQHGIWCQKSENEQVAGIERVKSWLFTKQLWFIADKVPKTIEQMKSYRWANREQKDGQLPDKERVFKLNDELPDCLRYALMTWPTLPQTPVPEADKPRDLSVLPAEMRHTIERMRRIEGRKPEPQSVVQDFWA